MLNEYKKYGFKDIDGFGEYSLRTARFLAKEARTMGSKNNLKASKFIFDTFKNIGYTPQIQTKFQLGQVYFEKEVS